MKEWFCQKKNVRDLSSRQMLDQINRDIAIWRTNKEMEDQWEREEMLEEEVEDAGPYDPFTESGSHVPEWHSAGSVLNEKAKDFDFEDLKFSDEDSEEIKVEDLPDLPFENPFGTTSESEAKPIPMNEHTDEYFGDNKLKEEPLKDNDEPIFYEEPV